MREHAPRASRCPPGLVGFLARIWASRFASGALMKLIAVLEAPECKTPTSKKPRDRPPFWGAARSAGGLSSHSAKPTTSHPASQKPRTRRHVCPPPERSEVQGGRGRATARAAGGAGGLFPHSAKPLPGFRSTPRRRAATCQTPGSSGHAGRRGRRPRSSSASPSRARGCGLARGF